MTRDCEGLEDEEVAEVVVVVERLALVEVEDD